MRYNPPGVRGSATWAASSSQRFSPVPSAAVLHRHRGVELTGRRPHRTMPSWPRHSAGTVFPIPLSNASPSARSRAAWLRAITSQFSARPCELPDPTLFRFRRPGQRRFPPFKMKALWIGITLASFLVTPADASSPKNRRLTSSARVSGGPPWSAIFSKFGHSLAGGHLRRNSRAAAVGSPDAAKKGH
jgi:hypothetical protein